MQDQGVRDSFCRVKYTSVHSLQRLPLWAVRRILLFLGIRIFLLPPFVKTWNLFDIASNGTLSNYYIIKGRLFQEKCKRNCKFHDIFTFIKSLSARIFKNFLFLQKVPKLLLFLLKCGIVYILYMTMVSVLLRRFLWSILINCLPMLKVPLGVAA